MTNTQSMTIDAALAALAPEGVTGLTCVHVGDKTPLWRVEQRGVPYVYCCTLDELVRALSVWSD